MIIFGESAGGASVDYYSYAWTKDPILSGFIAMSGVTGPIPMIKLQDSKWYNLSDKVGCGGKANGLRTVECMREQSVSTILKGLGQVAGAQALTYFGPTIDEKVVFSDYAKRRAAGHFIKKVNHHNHASYLKRSAECWLAIHSWKHGS
jgi:cholinesterase